MGPHPAAELWEGGRAGGMEGHVAFDFLDDLVDVALSTVTEPNGLR